MSVSLHSRADSARTSYRVFCSCLFTALDGGFRGNLLWGWLLMVISIHSTADFGRTCYGVFSLCPFLYISGRVPGKSAVRFPIIGHFSTFNLEFRANRSWTFLCTGFSIHLRADSGLTYYRVFYSYLFQYILWGVAEKPCYRVSGCGDNCVLLRVDSAWICDGVCSVWKIINFQSRILREIVFLRFTRKALFLYNWF